MHAVPPGPHAALEAPNQHARSEDERPAVRPPGPERDQDRRERPHRPACRRQGVRPLDQGAWRAGTGDRVRRPDGAYVVIRGQRRTVVAAEVGLPEIPAQVVAKPDEADRITDQMVENLHRAAMRDGEIVSGVEQLALVGISAAQIAKRATLPRERVNAALSVADKEQTRARVVAGDLTLDEAAIFAEFEHDAQAIEQLERAKQFGRPLSHTAQRLRDEAHERAVLLTEVDRLRADGLPVLDPGEVRDAHRFRLSDHVRAADGEPVPEDEWPNLPGAAVVVVSEWEYPENGDNSDERRGRHRRGAGAGVHPVWICRDPEAAGLVQRWTYLTGTRKTDASEEDQEAAAEAAREERRLVIANNKAWTSAEVVRRDWLRQFLTRKTPPQGAEALICEAVVGGQFTLTKAMDAAHRRCANCSASTPRRCTAAAVRQPSGSPTSRPHRRPRP